MTLNEHRAMGNLFKSPGCVYVFALLYMDGETRREVLGITPRHYRDITLANSWYDNISREMDGARQWVSDSDWKRARDALGRLRLKMVSR